jgi:hypothetical protein
LPSVGGRERERERERAHEEWRGEDKDDTGTAGGGSSGATLLGSRASQSTGHRGWSEVRDGWCRRGREAGGYEMELRAFEQGRLESGTGHAEMECRRGDE